MTFTSRFAAIARGAIDLAIVALVVTVLVGLLVGRLLPLLGHDALIIGGHSMEPTIPLGSTVVLERVPAEALAVGDIVTLRVGPKPSIYTHRIVRLVDLDGVPHIETRGDANPAPDATTTPVSAVVGRAAWSVPFLGYLLALLSVPIGIAFVIGLGAVLVIAATLLEEVAGGPAGGRSRAPTGPPLEGRVARHLAARRTLDQGR